MKRRSLHLQQFKYTMAVLLLLLTTSVIAQVGINTISPAEGTLLDITSTEKGVMIPKVNITSLSSIAPITGVTATVAGLAAAEGLLVYNTNNSTGPGYFYWTGTQWSEIGAKADPTIDSVSLTTDQIIAGNTFANVPGMSITFTARKTEVLVNLSLSGLGFTGSLTFGSFRLYNSTTTTVIGGTNTSAQSLWKSGPSTYSITTWSAAFSKKLTGLTIGNSYTIVLQAKTDNLLGTDGVALYPSSNPDTSHATITIFQ